MSIKVPGSSKITLGAGSKTTIRPSQGSVTATGGDITDVIIGDAIYRVHTFTGMGTFEITSATNNTATVEYLVVGGGGGGGGGSQGIPGVPRVRGGGGGAGGFLTGSISLNVGSYEITVGAAGVGGIVPGSLGQPPVPGTSGDPSKIVPSTVTSNVLIESFGGGGGGAASPGTPGGSGGGGYSPGVGITGQGNPGGSGYLGSNVDFLSGGGGGAGSSGRPASPTEPPETRYSGGSGLESHINGYSKFYAGGGGAAPNGLPGSGIGGVGGSGIGGNAIIYTGSGGGGGGVRYSGGNGSSGIVIIRYRIA